MCLVIVSHSAAHARPTPGRGRHSTTPTGTSCGVKQQQAKEVNHVNAARTIEIKLKQNSFKTVLFQPKQNSRP